MNSELLRIAKYVVVGGLAALVHYFSGIILNAAGVPVALAAGSGFAFGFVVSLVGHRTLTFQSRKPYSHLAPRMLIIAAVGLTYNSLLAPTLVQLNVENNIAILAGMATTPALNYFLMRLWVFKT